MRSLNPKILREYDIRGKVGVDLGEEEAYLIGRAFASELKDHGGRSIVLGRDGRLSSPSLGDALLKGLLESGADVVKIGLGPTPMTYFAHYHLKTDAALMVTGSHNPGNTNGFKMMMFQKSFFGAEIQKLGKRIETADFVSGRGSVRDAFVKDAYRDYLLDAYAHYGLEETKFSIVWDPGNGATGEVLKDLLSTLPGHHTLMNEAIDGTFPAHHPDPTVAENLVQIIDCVKEKKADLGIAFDGDGDRIGLVDGEGRIIWGDQLMMLLSEDVLNANPGATIIADVKASQVLFDHIKALGGVPLMWRTGHSLIKSKMAETKSPLAGEMSGHIFFADRHFGYDDALYAAMRLLGILGQKKLSLAQWYASIPHPYNTPEIRLECEGYDKFKIVEDVKDSLKNLGASFDETDGVRVSSAHGWWLLRASNTQEVLVARLEASTESGLASLKEELTHHLGEYRDLIPRAA